MQPGGSNRAGLRAEPLLLAAVVLAAAVYAAFSLLRWTQFANSGFDLGIFDQTVWHYSRFEEPANSVRGFENIWGDHFSPILALLAPLYWIWEDARVLLISQAVLLAAAAIPVFVFARDRLGRLAAYLFALAYLSFWGIRSALAWEFHELAFVPLLLGLLLLAADRRRWVAYFALLFALLWVKEDQSIVAVFLGIYLATLRAWRPALATVGIGVLWYVLVVRLLIPHFNPEGEYPYWSYGQFGDGPLSAIAHAVTHPGFTLETLFGDATKRQTLMYLFVPLLGLTFCSRTAILLLPLLAQRFFSSNFLHWSTEYHYTLAVAVILFIGAADGLSNVLRLWRRPVPAWAAPAVAALILVLNVGFHVAAPGTTGGPQKLWDAWRPDQWRSTPYTEGAQAAVAAVPPAVSVAAQDNLIPRLTHRDVAAEISPGTGMTDYVVAHVIGTTDVGTGINGGYGNVSRFVNSRLTTHEPVGYFDGWLVLRSRELPPADRAPGLVALEGARAEAVRRAAAAWRSALAAYDQHLVTCGADTECLQQGGAAFARAQERLAAALAQARSGARADCADQAELADRGAAAVAANLAAIRRAAAAGDEAALREQGAALRVSREQDQPGYVERYVALCTTGATAR